MDHENKHRKANDKTQESNFQEKVFALADEVLRIIKELHQEHKELVNSKLLAEKMFDKESIKEILFDHGLEGIDRENRVDPLKEAVDDVLNKLAELVPDSMMKDFADMRSQDVNKSVYADSAEKLNLAVKILKKYVNSISGRVTEHEDLLQKIANYLSEMEKYLTNELSSVQGKFKEDRTVEKSISSDISEIKKSFDISNDINAIKRMIFGKLENITNSIEKKKEQDILRLKETERTLEIMSTKMNDIVYEADAIKKRSLEAELDSIHDNLTQICNRKAYDKKIEETLANFNRYSSISSLLVFDIDYFKKINDNFGHHIGDLTLKKVAQIFKKKLRKTDFIARYGGEEFVCILPHTLQKEARKVAEEIRSFIEGANFTFKGNKVPVTISAGISTLRQGDDALSIFERADIALYMSKNSGRNLVSTEDDVERAGKSFSDSLIDNDIDND